MHWVAGIDGGERQVHIAGDKAVGKTKLNQPHQVRVINRYEMAAFSKLAPDEMNNAFISLLEYQEPSCVVVADNIHPLQQLLSGAERFNVPLMVSPLSARSIINYLEQAFAGLMVGKVTMHGVFMDILGLGVLITGDSGTGKSELALELVSRGHRLVADDAPEFTKFSSNTINGTCPLGMSAFLEVRGLGILNVQKLYGNSVVKSAKYLKLVVHLKQMTPERLQSMDRLEQEQRTCNVLGVNIPEVTLPVAPGRNLAVLLECAVRNYNLKNRGYSAVEDFTEKQRLAMESGYM